MIALSFVIFVATVPMFQSLGLIQGRSAGEPDEGNADKASKETSQYKSVYDLDSYTRIKIDDNGVEWIQPNEINKRLQAASTCNTTVWWLHVPKTGTSFHGSAASCKWAKTRSHANHQNIPENADDLLLSQVVTVLRHPSHRLLSAYYWIKKDPGCCTGDWGWASEVFKPVRKSITQGVAPKTAIGKFLGCETNMITGQAGCMAGEDIPKERIQEAKRRLSKFLFVGLLERWDLSICLYNYITTGTRHIHAHQLYNSRPTKGKGKNYTHYDISEVPPDRADNEVYAAAVRRFEADCAKHKITQASCPVGR